MEKFISSYKALEKLCETQPDSPIFIGGLKTIGGTVAGGLSYPLGWITQDVINSLSHYSSPDVMGITFALLSGTLCAGTGLVSLYLLADGVSSLAKPFGNHKKSKKVYYRNGGLTNTPSLSDRIFGSITTPLDSFEGIKEDLEGYVFVNGVISENTSISSRQGTRMIMVGKTMVPQTYTEYTVNLDGTLYGKKIKTHTVTEDEEFATNIVNKPKGSELYLLGSMYYGNIDLKMIGDAFDSPDREYTLEELLG